MKDAAPPLRNLMGVAKNVFITPQLLNVAAEGWLLDCEIRQLSPRTREARKSTLDKLRNFVRSNEIPQVGVSELKRFLLSLTPTHENEKSRYRLVPC